MPTKLRGRLEVQAKTPLPHHLNPSSNPEKIQPRGSPRCPEARASATESQPGCPSWRLSRLPLRISMSRTGRVGVGRGPLGRGLMTRLTLFLGMTRQPTCRIILFLRMPMWIELIKIGRRASRDSSHIRARSHLYP